MIRQITDFIKRKNEGGYIALISAIIISALLIIITFSVNFSSFFARFNILDSEFKKISSGLAEACVDTAMLEIAKDNSWKPAINGTCVNVGDACPTGPKICKICEVKPVGSQRIIKSRAMYQKAYTNIVATTTVSATNVTVNAWSETATYGPGCTLP